MNILRKLSIPVLSTFLAVAPLKAEHLHGHINHVNTFEPIQGLNLNAEGLDSCITDEHGYYSLGEDGVIIDPKYNLPTNITDNNRLYDSQGRRITNLDKQNIEARLLPEHVNLPSGKYFIQLESGLTIPFVKLDRTRTIPNILREKQRAENIPRRDLVRRLRVTGEGYHTFSREIDIGNNTEYDFFMIPVDSAQSEYYNTILDVYKSLCTAWRPRVPIIRNPRDLPYLIYNQNIPEPNDTVNYLDGLLSAIQDAGHNNRNNWFDSNFIDTPLDSGDVGINIRYVIRREIPGGGDGWTQQEEGYNYGPYLGTPKRFTVYINRDFRSQRTVNAVIRRELARVLGLDDDSPDDNYIMRSGGPGNIIFHPDELKSLDMHYNIIQRDYGIFNRPDMDWYLTGD